MVDRQVHEGGVQSAAHHLGQKARGGCIDDLDPHTRVARSHGLQELGQKPSAGGPDHAYANDARHLVVHRGDVETNRLELGLYAPCPFEHDSAFLGESPAGAVDEGRAEFLLEARDVGRNVRLDGVQGTRRGAEGPVVHDCHEGVQLANVHLVQGSAERVGAVSRELLVALIRRPGFPTGRSIRAQAISACIGFPDGGHRCKLLDVIRLVCHTDVRTS